MVRHLAADFDNLSLISRTYRLGGEKCLPPDVLWPHTHTHTNLQYQQIWKRTFFFHWKIPSPSPGFLSYKCLVECDLMSSHHVLMQENTVCALKKCQSWWPSTEHGGGSKSKEMSIWPNTRSSIDKRGHTVSFLPRHLGFLSYFRVSGAVWNTMTKSNWGGKGLFQSSVSPLIIEKQVDKNQREEPMLVPWRGAVCSPAPHHLLSRLLENSAPP